MRSALVGPGLWRLPHVRFSDTGVSPAQGEHAQGVRTPAQACDAPATARWMAGVETAERVVRGQGVLLHCATACSLALEQGQRLPCAVLQLLVVRSVSRLCACRLCGCHSVDRRGSRRYWGGVSGALWGRPHAQSHSTQRGPSCASATRKRVSTSTQPPRDAQGLASGTARWLTPCHVSLPRTIAH